MTRPRSLAATRVASFRHGPLTVEHHVLPNGLTVLHQPDHQAPVVSYQTWFRVGSRHERPGKTGIAHLFEHLMFKETRNMAEGEYDRRIEAMGGRVNAATWLDWTYYYADVPSDGLETLISLEADRMEHMTLGSAQLEAEREVVINERKERVDNEPAGLLGELLWSKAYTRHPYGQPTIGWMPDIEGLSLEDCLAFYRQWYAPDNAVIAVSGDVTTEQLLGLVDRAYGHLEAQGQPSIQPIVEPAQDTPRRLERSLSIGAERLLLGYHGPAATDPRAAALEVLNEALFEGDSARMQRALVTDGELASGFYAFVPAFREPGLYEVGVDLRPGVEAEAAEAVLLDAFAEVARDGLRPDELEKARNRVETQFYRQLQTTQQRAGGIGYWQITADDFRRLFTAPTLIQAVTGEAVAEAARAFLRPENRTVVIGRPAS